MTWTSQTYPLDKLTEFGEELLQTTKRTTENILSDEPRDLAAALYLIAGDLIGYHAVKISQATGLPRDECVWMGMRMRSAGALRRGQIVSNWSDEQTGDFNFVVDAMFAAGVILRRGRGKNSKIALRPLSPTQGTE